MAKSCVYNPSTWLPCRAKSKLAATPMATARSPRHHALEYRTALATAVAVSVATNLDMAYAN